MHALQGAMANATYDLPSRCQRQLQLQPECLYSRGPALVNDVYAGNPPSLSLSSRRRHEAVATDRKFDKHLYAELEGAAMGGDVDSARACTFATYAEVDCDSDSDGMLEPPPRNFPTAAAATSRAACNPTSKQTTPNVTRHSVPHNPNQKNGLELVLSLDVRHGDLMESCV